MSNIFLQKDYIFKCPECDTLLYVLRRDIYFGEVSNASDFIPINNRMPKPISGKEIDACYNCGYGRWLEGYVT